MFGLFKRVWCEIRAWHPSVLWASEWTPCVEGRQRMMQLRCADCDAVTGSWTEVERRP